jgi:transposase
MGIIINYKSLNKYLREKPKGSDKSRKQIYKAEKKRNSVSPVRESGRVGGRPKIKKQVIVVDDLPSSVVNNWICELGAEETEEEHTEKALALLMERAKEDQLRQKNRYS